MCCEGDVHCGIRTDGVILRHAVHQSQTVNAFTARFCSTTFVHRSGENTWWYGTPSFFMTMKGVTPLLLLSRNSYAAGKGEILEHPPYSPDISPCDYDLFTKVK